MHEQDSEIGTLFKFQAQEERTLATAKLFSMLLSMVYFPEFCHTSSTRS